MDARAFQVIISSIMTIRERPIREQSRLKDVAMPFAHPYQPPL